MKERLRTIMDKMLKNEKGFSLVELLIALLIMAVIAAAAVALFGGVLDSGRKGSDNEQAENIRRQILVYMNATGDTNLDGIGATAAAAGVITDDVIQRLTQKIEIASDGKVSLDAAASGFNAGTHAIPGTYGPYLDGSQNLLPRQSGMVGWIITLDEDVQKITITPDSTAANCVLKVQ